ncbi:unnamed protein product, partial [marine sediment metagenome]
MAFNKNLAVYIKKNLTKGYDINTIRDVLYKWGYKLEDIDQTISSIYPPKTKKPLKIRKERNILNLFFKPPVFFANPANNLKKSLKYFFYSLLILFLTQTTTITVQNLLKKENFAYILTLTLTNTITPFLFLISLFLFFLILIGIYFILFNYVLKTEINFSLLLTALFFSLVPYILINSLNNIPFYNIITIFNLSISVFS